MENRDCNAGNYVTPSGWEKESLKKENKQTNVSFEIHEDQTISTVIQENRRMYSVIHKKCGTKKDYSKSTGIKNNQTISPAPYQRTFTRVTSSQSRSNSVLDKLYCKYSHQMARTQSRSSFTPDEETRQRLNSRRQNDAACISYTNTVHLDSLDRAGTGAEVTQASARASS